MKTRKFSVICRHVSEYADPITLSKGDMVHVGQEYAGPEDWKDWYYCTAEDQRSGWVPLQVIEPTGEQSARVIEDYTARELNVEAGEIVIGSRVLSGWIWCEAIEGSKSGWVPEDHLVALEE